MELVAFVGTDQESWGQITGLINHGEWEKIILIKAKGAEYAAPKEVEEIIVDSAKPLTELKTELQNKLKSHLSGFEASVTLASGNGKEHMALIAALLAVPIGLRIAVFTKNGIDFIT